MSASADMPSWSFGTASATPGPSLDVTRTSGGRAPSLAGTAVASRSAHDRAFSHLAMLRITNTTRAGGLTVVLEGRLTGPWVDELARCWEVLRATGDTRSICVQLDGVTFIDAAGKTLLRTMHGEGAALAASGCMTRAIL